MVSAGIIGFVVLLAGWGGAPPRKIAQSS